MNLMKYAIRVVLVLGFLFVQVDAWSIGEQVPPASQSSDLSKSWMETGDIKTLIIKNTDGKILFQRSWRKNSGKPTEGPQPTDLKPLGQSPKNSAEKSSSSDKPVEKSEAKKPAAIWKGKLKFGAIAHKTSKNKNNTFQELYNQKDGFGIVSLDLQADAPKDHLRLKTDGLGSWNSSVGGDVDYRHEAQVHVRAKFSRTDWHYGALSNPSTIKERFSLDATCNPPNRKWHPRLALNFKGSESAGKSIRPQENFDRIYPRDRISQTWNPDNRDVRLTLSGGTGNLDMAFSYGERTDTESTTKEYTRDLDFNGIRDTLRLWKRQDNFSKYTTGKLAWQINEKYLFAAVMTTTQTDNKFDLLRNRFEPFPFLVTNGIVYGFQGQDHGRLDGCSQNLELSIDAHPNSKFDLDVELRRNKSRNRGDGVVRFYDQAGSLVSSDDGSTLTRTSDGQFDIRTAYKGCRDTRIYAGYRRTEREDYDENSLGVFTYDALGIRTIVGSTLSVDTRCFLNFTERSGYVGVTRFFGPKLELDLRHEQGKLDDENNPGSGNRKESLTKDFDHVNQVLSAKSRFNNDVSLLLKVRRDKTDRTNIDTYDERKDFSIYTDWAPQKGRTTLGGGFQKSDGNFSIAGIGFENRCESLSFNGSYKLNAVNFADFDLVQTVGGGVTSFDQRIGEIRLRRLLKRGGEASIGYSRRTYKNSNASSDNFIDDALLLSYGIEL